MPRSTARPSQKLTKSIFTFCPCMSPAMTNRFRNICWNYNIYLAVGLVMVVMVTLLSIDSLRTSNTIVFSVYRPGEQPVYLNGIYKKTIEQTDGSIDVVFNVPRGVETLARANASGSGIDPEILNVSSSAQSTQPPAMEKPVKSTKSQYPLTVSGQYVINPAFLCPSGVRLDYVILVHSATAYFQRRRTIRETFGARNLFGKVKHRVLFLMGETIDPHTTKNLHLEALAHGDILQGPFRDSYHNLTHKGAMGFRWLAEYCSNVKVIVKIDDDVFMNPFQFVKEYILSAYSSTKKYSISCHVRPVGTSPIVRGNGKWQVKNSEFPEHTHYPFPHCMGYFVILTSDLLRPMNRAISMSPFFWIDDVYLYGVVPAVVGNVTFENIQPRLSTVFSRGKDCYQTKGKACPFIAVSQWQEEEQRTLWRMVLSQLSDTEKQTLSLFGN